MTDPMSRHVNALEEAKAGAALLRCCGSRRWAERVLARRPFASDAALLRVAEREWWTLERDDWLEAFAAHPRIGEHTGDDWSQREQSGMDAAGSETRRAIADGNTTYEQRFGYVFLICAAGRSADEMLAELRRRLDEDPASELRTAAGEQAKIMRLRLEKLLTP
ncbi:MAG: 2-oxo-4-hydroxy-4-carboxy-5-ureidoimidazoline decarboxylase [Gemmatimonadales bacterium]